MKSLDEMNAQERQHYLDSLETKELTRMKAVLLAGVLDSEAVDKVVASLHAILNRRVVDDLRPTLIQMTETLGERFGDLVHGRAGPFYIEERTYGDWLALASGTAWLEPKIKFCLHFASKSRLEVCFDLEREENEVSLEEGGERAACIYLGFQTVSRYAPVEVGLGQGPEPTDSILFQMHLSQAWISPKEPVLRLDYAVFHKGEQKNVP